MYGIKSYVTSCKEALDGNIRLYKVFWAHNILIKIYILLFDYLIKKFAEIDGPWDDWLLVAYCALWLRMLWCCRMNINNALYIPLFIGWGVVIFLVRIAILIKYYNLA